MNQYITGAMIKKLRESKKITQLELADQLHVSDKAVSKWERGKGYPDIALLEPLAVALGVSVLELLSGSDVTNRNVSSNMLRTKFYVCPVCGNVLFGVGESVVSCHGITLPCPEGELPDQNHRVHISVAEDEYYVQICHEMTKKHYISFIAGVSDSSVQFKKLYPEGDPAARVKMSGVRWIYYYCNKDGLFRVKAAETDRHPE